MWLGSLKLWSAVRRTSLAMPSATGLLGVWRSTGRRWRWQRAARAHLQDGRQVPAQAPHCRHDFTRATRKVQSSGNRSTAGQSARAKARAGRNCRHGKQDSTDHLGNHDTWRDLSCRPPTGTGRIKARIHELAEQQISFTRLRERCDVMANRSDREQGQPTECPRRHSLRSRMGPCSRTPSGPAVSIDCINRPDRRLHPTNATASIYSLQCLLLAMREPSTEDIERAYCAAPCFAAPCE